MAEKGGFPLKESAFFVDYVFGSFFSFEKNNYPILSAFAESKVDTLVVTTKPEMHCSGCETRIKSNIRFVKGTKKIETSVPNQTVTIIYDRRKSTYADYKVAFRKLGYDIEIVGK